jgi:hypothetical protein
MMMKRREFRIMAGLIVLVAGMTLGCAQQPRAVLDSTTAAVRQGYDSFLYTDATSVQLLFWTETSGGALMGETDELQNLNPGSPTFWFGYQLGVSTLRYSFSAGEFSTG